MWGSIHVVLLLAACIIGQEMTNVCDDPNCDSCPVSQTDNCTECYIYSGTYLTKDPSSGKGVCEPCKSSTCFVCSSETVCDMCSEAGDGPVKPSTDGSCAPCGDFCTICDNAGGGKCDPDGCSPKYAFNDTTKTCQPCKGADCPGCVVPNTCPTCVDGTGLDSSTGQLPQAGCKNCAVPHAKICTGDYKKFVFCQDQYNANYTANTCDPICATIGKNDWNGRPASSCSASKHPIKYIIIHQAKTDFCYDQKTCQSRVKALQAKAMNSPKDKKNPGLGLPDVEYHYMIGEDGNNYNGRSTSCCGKTYTGKSAKYNCNSYDIAFLGTYSTRAPVAKALQALLRLVSKASDNKYNTSCVDAKHSDLDPNWQIVAHSDLQCTTCPGGKTVIALQQMFGVNNNATYNAFTGRFKPAPFCKSGQTDTHQVKK